MNIAVLGPDGSFTGLAAEKYIKDKKLGNAKLSYKKTIYDIFELVKNNEAELAIAPLENSLSGTVVETLDRLNDSDLKITDEIILPIHHCLITLNDTKKIEKVISHPQAIAQCSNFLHKNYPNVEYDVTLSTSEAIQKIKGLTNAAAVAQKETALKNGLRIISENIEDSELNMTRFIVVSKHECKEIKNPKTTVIIIPNKDMPGLLYSLLGEFANRGINLTKIESRPSRVKIGEYIFFIDFTGDIQDENIKECITALKNKADVKILGTYENKLK